MQSRLIAAFIACLAAAPSAHACTTAGFESASGKCFAQNYDWMVDSGLVMVNKRGVGKQGFRSPNPAKWVSKYGSVTFNQYGADLPTGGMNEKGLAYGIMWLEETRYEPADDRASLSVLQWAQYQLDNCATVAEVREQVARVRVEGESSGAPVHYHFSDALGESLIVEFVGGKAVLRGGADLPARVLSNDTYESCEAALRQSTHDAGGGLPQGRGSVARFIRAASMVRNPSTEAAQAAGFRILDEVAQGDFTKWSIVYEQEKGRITWKTLRAPEPKSIDLSGLDFSCGMPGGILDMNAPLTGDVTAKLAPFSIEANRALIGETFSRTEFLASTPAEQLDALAAAPAQYPCLAR